MDNRIKKGEGVQVKQSFPLLRTKQLPYGEDLQAVRFTDPLLYMETLRMREFARILDETPPHLREAVFLEILWRHLGTSPITRSIYTVNESVTDASEILRWFRRMIPPKYSEKFSSEGVVAFADDYIKLLLNWRDFEIKAREGKDKRLFALREYEARQMLNIATLLLRIRLLRAGHKEEDATHITRHLEEKFFMTGMLTDVVVVSWHDPRDEERVCHWCLKGKRPPVKRGKLKGLIRKETHLTCRWFEFDGHRHMVYYDSRGKTDADILRKMLSKDIPDPSLANQDMEGLRIVFFSKDGFEAGLRKLCLEVWNMPFMTSKVSDNTNGNLLGASRNGRSSKRFCALKFKTASYGFYPEVMLQMLEPFLNHLCSKGRERHGLYRARQMFGEVLPLICPAEVYGVDLSDSLLLEEVFRSVLAV